MKPFIALAAPLLIPLSGAAAFAAQQEPRTTWNPPAAYDHPYTGHMTLFQVPQRQVPSLCKQLFLSNSADIEVTPAQKGCAWHYQDNCLVITIDRPFRGITPAAVLRHETGHCNGWPADHPE